MRVHKQRYQRLRFRVLDARALEALRSMLANLPPPRPSTTGVPRTGTHASVSEVVAELSRLLAATPPFASALEHFEVRLDVGELAVNQVRLAAATGETAPPVWLSSPVAIVRRAGEEVYLLVPLS